MKSFFAVASLFLLIDAHVLSRADQGTDPAVLNFALTLEHFENAFYRQGLQNFSEYDFKCADFPPWVRGRFQQISEHEQTHVDFLTTALKAAGATPVEPCTYNFPYTDPKSFVDLSAAFETVGSSAYTGAAALIENKDYLTAAGTILVVEARHSSWVDSSVKEQNAWSGPFEVPLDPNAVFTIASSFITACPESNPPLPAKANPSLAVAADARPGQEAALTFEDSGNSSSLFLSFLTSNGPASSPITINGDQKTATIPESVKGTVFAFVTNNNETVSVNNTVAGPALIMFPFGPDGKLLN
ncbi:hypothetical protein K435DRAFT_118132 [Dendrothele bispora CBS 962.96]|uniref:Ferritin-like domain-containing protein n=1 Tax=Dendrothele bispora (strain CBS 962.96) TaxID=1314807 RepID=A0A4S8MSC2_DENBC|nr:hypothetical protein K435DRAFT_118132 [Dendrothele bispora CBS 962.96]